MAGFTGPTKYDFTGIGINLTLANGDQEKYNTFIENFTKDAGTAYTYPFPTIHYNKLRQITSFTINNVTYDMRFPIGRGSFGRVFAVHSGTFYALKQQFLSQDGLDVSKDLLNEMLCQHIVSQHTYNGTPLAPKIIATCVDDKYQYTVMEMMISSGEKSDIGTYLLNPDIDKAYDFLTYLADCLRYLQNTLKFTHGDLKYDNVKFDINNKIRLIDFGQARLEVPVLIECSTYTTNFNRCRDLIQFSAFQLRRNRSSQIQPKLNKLLTQIITCGNKEYSHPTQNGNPATGELIPYFDSLNDLDCEKSKCVGTPEGVKNLIKTSASCVGCLWGGKRKRKTRRRSQKNRTK
jgi:serine/threonine protein kinase